MHLSLPHSATAVTLVGVAVWLAGLTLILVLKNRAEHKNKGHLAWVPLAVYLVLSAVGLVVAGIYYRHAMSGGGAMPLKPATSSKPAKPAVTAAKAGKAPGASQIAAAYDDASLESDAWPGGLDDTSSSA